MRKLLIECMEQPPPICAFIRKTRERLKDEAGAAGGKEAAREFSQERVAQRVGVSLKAYRAYEYFREPNYERRQAIARALGLSGDFFESVLTDDARLRQIVHEELEAVREQVARIEELLESGPTRARRAPS